MTILCAYLPIIYLDLLLHLDVVENEEEPPVSSIVSRTNSEVNLCIKSIKEQEWPRIQGAVTRKTKVDKEKNNNKVQQSESVSVQSDCAGMETVPNIKSSDTGGIGVVRANTGRLVSSSRYRTELEVTIY